MDRDVEGTAERVCPDAPVPVVDEHVVRSRPGGAGLAACLAAADGRQVTLVTALANDAAGAELEEALTSHGVDVVDLGLHGPTPEKVRVTASGHPLVRIDRGGDPSEVGPPTAAVKAAIGWGGAVLVSDYGRGVASEPGVRAALETVAERVPLVWDPHPRGRPPVPGATLATPNAAEAATFAARTSDDAADMLVERASALRREWGAGAVCVTVGERGAVLVRDGEPPLAVPAEPVPRADACGAGDRFASAAACALADGADLAEAITAAVEHAGRFVAAGGWTDPLDSSYRQSAESRDATDVIARTRATGGTVVATGGCFDLLHAGHVRVLDAARALGDCLVVCLNSDASVSRLKGRGRPLVRAEDRAEVLLGLGSVDAVAVFDEDTPERLLERLRPHVWAKGADYVTGELPEKEVVERHGGHCVGLPLLAGRSTTELIRKVSGDAG
jgi:rfaE bifunctional protein nucleotidyltransferase chain/domain/rfaE bifunctional protein kinase chain/domain